MQNNNLLLETTLLNSFVGEDTWTYVRLGPGYVKKKGRDLNEGNLVVVNNEAIHKTLPEIEPELRKSLRYQLAEDELYVRNKNGKNIKKFRILLLRGLVATNTPNLEERIMLEDGFDFSSENYQQFKNILLKYVIGVKEDAVRNWLDGATLSPRKWENFSRLSPINPEFKEIADSFGKDIGYYAAYQLYVGIRTTIMSYIAKRVGKGSEIDRESIKSVYTTKISGKYKPEIELILKLFMHEVDRKRSAGRITKIKTIEREREHPSKKQQPEPHLSKGVFVGDLDLPLIDMNEVRDHSYILNNAIYDAFNRYSIRRHKEIDVQDLETASRAAVVLLTFPYYIFTRLIPNSLFETHIYELNLENAVRTFQITKEQAKAILKEEYSRFLVELRKGKVDKLLGAKENTVANVVDLVRQYKAAMPRTHEEALKLKLDVFIQKANIGYLNKQNTNRKVRREQERQLLSMENRRAELNRYIDNTYKLTQRAKRLLLSFYMEKQTLGEITKTDELISIVPKLQKAKLMYENMGYRFFSKNDVISILTHLGVGDAINFFDQRTFV